jgi:rhodanese-related sulfurtransferase
MSHSDFPQTINSINVSELALRLAEGDDNLQLIDVRERQEIAIASLNGFVSLPLSEFSIWEEQIATLFNPDQETLVLCHHGMRSAQMCQWLLNIGFSNVKNITGGIDAYSLMVDPRVPRY